MMKKEKYKIVGIPVSVPKEAKYMAFDASGQLWFYGADITVPLNIEMFVLSKCCVSPLIRPSFCLDVPNPCSNPDWWKGTKREISASSGVVCIYVKAPIWAKWMAFDSTGELCFYSGKPKIRTPWNVVYLGPCIIRWGYSGLGIISDFKIKVSENIKNPDWWKKTLRRI
jgi:hypothetical protein